MVKTVKYLAIIGISFLVASQNTWAQPLDPSVPGFENVKPPERPNLKIISPEINSTVLSKEVKLKFIFSGVKLVDPVLEKTSVRGEGHLKITFAREGEPIPPLIFSAQKSPLKFEDVPEGSYRITLEIVKNSGSSYSPPVEETTKFSLRHPIIPSATPAPTPTPSPPSIRERIPLTNNELYIILGVIFTVFPAVYLRLTRN